MRAIKLSFQAFGPFKEKEIIEFDNFGKDGIFLISGDTGAGKTSIFDAISYALFGKSSAGERTDDELRFTAAAPDEETFVELEFEYKKKKYIIRRSPKYKRFKKNSTTETTDKHKTANLILPNGEEIDGNKEVDLYINNLLNVDKDQFNHIAMLAQGKFSEFLKAPSSEKMEIFREIFQTLNYQRLEENISRKLKEAKDEFRLLENTRNEIVSNFIISEENNEEFVSNIKLGSDYLVSFVENLDSELKSKLRDLSNDLESRETSLELLRDKLKKVEEYHINKKNLKEKRSELDEISIDFEETKKKYDDLKSKDDEIEILIKNEDSLQKEIDKFNLLIDIQKQIEETEISIKSKKEDLEKKTKEIKNTEEEIDKIKKYLDDNKNIREEKIKLENDFEKLENLKDEFSDIKKSIDTRISKENLINNNLPKYEKIKKDYSDLNNELNKMEDIYFESQAGILAKTLKIGEPCPVCGSTEHPNVAEYHDDIPSKESIDLMRNQLDEKAKEKSEIHDYIQAINSEIKHIDTSIKNFLERRGISEDEIKSEFDRVEDEKSKIQIKLEEAARTITKIEEREEVIVQLSKDLEIARNIKADLDQAINLEVNNLNRLSAEENKESQNLADKDLDMINSEIINNKNRLKEARIYVDDVRKHYTDVSANHAGLSSEIKILENNLNDEFDLDLEKLSEEIIMKQTEFKKKKQEENSINFAYETNEKQVKRLKAISKNINSEEANINNISQLNDVLKGNIKGIANIKFETFVQSRFFDQLIAVSNKRFYDMTEGKYSLRRKTEAQNKGRQFGLDFEVVDHHNKTNRNINTLSGGESFQASLSLALGLSDIVSMNVGSIQIDSMFIDEGFGTLDSETLSKVMSTLSKISSNNKLIGIISHVKQLKEQIDKQIHVKKTNEGYSKIVKQIF